jgi:hypothetical protein
MIIYTVATCAVCSKKAYRAQRKLSRRDTDLQVPKRSTVRLGLKCMAAKSRSQFSLNFSLLTCHKTSAMQESSPADVETPGGNIYMYKGQYETALRTHEEYARMWQAYERKLQEVQMQKKDTFRGNVSSRFNIVTAYSILLLHVML